MNTQLGLGLPAAAPSDTVVINARCTLRAQDDQRVIVVGGLPVYHYCAADAVAEAYAMVMLVESGFAQQTEVARAFGKSDRTVRRRQEMFFHARVRRLRPTRHLACEISDSAVKSIRSSTSAEPPHS